jgi:hypothetical protein
MDSVEFFKITGWKVTVAFLFFILLFLTPTVPCYTGEATAPGAPKAIGTWGFCSLNLETIVFGRYYNYFGLENSYIIGIVFLMLFAYILSSALMYFLSKRHKA